LSGASVITWSQAPDYRTIFGDDWKAAEEYVTKNEPWIREVFNKYDIGFNEAVAVIFPELVRYSAIRDKMEITLLKALYVNLGKQYANFSVGHLQMKPSFAEMLGMAAPGMAGHKYSLLVRDSSDFDDIKDYRSAIIKDLENPVSQINYLVVFLRICSKRFNIRKMDADEKVRFLSTAYNYGFFRSENEIRSMERKKFFSTSLLSHGDYSYSDISVFWYREHIGKNNHFPFP
jgi:hypothetical protein